MVPGDAYQDTWQNRLVNRTHSDFPFARQNLDHLLAG